MSPYRNMATASYDEPHYLCHPLHVLHPQNPLYITLADLINCKVGDTIVGMLTDVHAFYQYDRREELMPHDEPEN
eukprot:scaffold255186_cov29-Tisochrysis_lutea.AAC.6